jgi:dihydrolipoamide dehydrogenase
VPVDNKIICDNEGALEFDSVPKRLGVIGAGVIGLELGSVVAQARRGSADPRGFARIFWVPRTRLSQRKRGRFYAEPGLAIELGVSGRPGQQRKKRVSVAYKTAEGKESKLECDRLIVSIGRVPNTEGLGADKVGLRIDAKGFIEVDKNCRASLPRVYAVGDVVRGPMLAHKGEDEGVMVAEIIAGQHGHVNYDAIPWVMYTMPEIAWVGKDRAAAEGRRRGLSRRAAFRSRTTGARSGATSPRDSSRCSPTRRPTGSSAFTRSAASLRADRRGRGRDGIRRVVRGHRAHLPRAPVDVGGDARSRARGRQAVAQRLNPPRWCVMVNRCRI